MTDRKMISWNDSEGDEVDDGYGDHGVKVTVEGSTMKVMMLMMTEVEIMAFMR